MQGTKFLTDIIGVFNYVFTAAVLAALANKLGLCRWKAWVPFVNTWYSGYVADECSLRRNRKDPGLRNWALLSEVAVFFIALIFTISITSYLTDYIMVHPDEPIDTYGFFELLRIPGLSTRIIVLFVLLLICTIPDYLCRWQIFKYFVPKQAVTYFVVSCVPGLGRWVLLYLVTRDMYDFDQYHDPDSPSAQYSE